MRKPVAVALLAALVAVLVVTWLLPMPAEAQCAMCRTAFDSPEGRKMVRNFQIGIVFLLVVPFAAIGTVGYLAVRGKKRLAAEEQV